MLKILILITGVISLGVGIRGVVRGKNVEDDGNYQSYVRLLICGVMALLMVVLMLIKGD